MSSRPVALTALRDDLEWRGVRSLPELATVRALSTILFRLSQQIGRYSALLAYVVKQVNHVLTGADIAWQAVIGPGLRLYHPTGVVIGPDVRIGARCEIQQGVTLGAARERGIAADGRVDSPRVGDDSKLGAGSRVIGPIQVGDRVVVGANAVVVTDVPADSLCLGVPARIRPLRTGS